MSKLVLIGGGGHCKSVLDSALKMKFFEKIVITDECLPPGTKILGCEVVGNDSCLQQLREDGYEYAFITLGCVRVGNSREKLAAKISSLGFKFAVVQDPSSVIAQNVKIGSGSYIGKNVVINTDATIGKHCIINTGAIIEHECEVGDFTHVSVGTVLCGCVSVKNNCMIGAGSVVIQGMCIGSNVQIGANSTVLSDVGDNMTYYGTVKVQTDKN